VWRPSWSPDGKFLALVDRNTPQAPYSIFLLTVDTGEKRRLSSPPKEYDGDFAPKFSPNGRDLAFGRSSSSVSSDLYVVSLTNDGMARGEPRRLTFEGRVGGLDWTEDNRKLIFSWYQSHGSGINLWTIPVFGGTPERLAVAGENAANPSVSRAGSRLVYEGRAYDSNIWRIPGPNSTDRTVPTKFIASTQWELEPQFSTDGKKIAFSSGRSGSGELWVCDPDGHNPVQLTTFGGPEAGSPRWSPDSRWIAFDNPSAGNLGIYVISADGGVPRRLTSETSNEARPSWSRDGQWIYFGSNRSGAWQIWKAPAHGGAAVQVTNNKGAQEAFESSDGKSVYYAKLDAPGIWKVPVEGGEEIQVLKDARWSLWALPAEGIYFFELNNPAGPPLKFYNFATSQTTVHREFSKETRVNGGDTALSVSPDGRWILYTQLDQLGSDLMLVENFQ